MNLSRRLQRILFTSYRLADKVDRVEYWPSGSRLELSILLYHLARTVHPQRYLTFLKLRLPWFVALTGPHGFPRIEVATRVGKKYQAAWGPFRARGAAEAYAAEVEASFQLRRCTEILQPYPDHPGCIYGEMNQCLRPCQEAVSAEQYECEATRVKDFLESNGRAAIGLLSAARDRASEEAAFEEAAQIHKRIDKLKGAAALRDEVIREFTDFSGVALVPSVVPRQVLMWPLVRGLWQQPLHFDLPAEGSPRSLDAELRTVLKRSFESGRTDGDSSEELAIFARWYYSSWRDGEWFPTEAHGNVNYRKLVRGISRLAQNSVTA